MLDDPGGCCKDPGPDNRTTLDDPGGCCEDLGPDGWRVGNGVSEISLNPLSEEPCRGGF